MKLSIFSVFDSAAGAFLQPFFAPAVGSAVRSLTDAVNDDKHEFSKHAADYSLFILGSFDDADGTIEHSKPEHIVNCLSLVIKQVP